MAEETRVHVLDKAGLRADLARPWQDPERLAAFGAAKRSALLSNPLSASDNDPVQLVGARGGIAAGRLDLVAGELSIDGRRAPVLWTSGLFVDPSSRNSMVAVSILMKMHRLSPICMVCGVSQQAVPFFKKLKWVDIELRRYVQLRRARAIVERYVGHGIGARAIARCGDLLAAGHGGMLHLLARLRQGKMVIRRVDRAPPELDRLFASAPTTRVHSHRSCAWLDWLLASGFDSDPRTRHELYVVCNERGAIVAYFLTKVRFYTTATARELKNLLLGSVQDWMVFDPAITDASVVTLAVDSLRAHPVDAVEVCTSDARLGRSLQYRGFVPAGVLHVMFRAAPGSALADPAFKEPSVWRLRPAEGDNYFF